MKLHRILYLLLAVSVACFGQKTSKPKAPKTLKSYPQDTTATYRWVRDYVESVLKANANTGTGSGVVITTNPPIVIDKPASGNGVIALTPIKDAFLPNVLTITGSYELRYIESRPDDHLNLKIEQRGNDILLSDTGNSLQSVSYTLNGWTDLENCGKLENEPILPYRLYHVSKYSVDRPTLKETWMAMYANPKARFRRSELFFYVVPKDETWNPVGESNNPIGRPLAFSKLPAFALKNRAYGFEYDFLDEANERKEELSIQFNWKTGKKHLKLYAEVLSSYLKSLPTRKTFDDLSQQECIDFANRLPIELIVAFDIEPPNEDQWIINYDSPNFARNMGYVIGRLRERGALAYNWLDSPDKSPNNLRLGETTLYVHGRYGNGNTEVEKYRNAYKNIENLGKGFNSYSVVSTGYGYTSYDNNLSPSDGNGQNISPQLTYLKSLDASELWKRAWPDKEQVYFSWPFQEFDFVEFPPNHVVEVPQHNARARRTDNKPLYPPNHWEDNLTLGLLNAKYLFYWSPGPVGWNPANVSSYNNAYTGGFHVWTYEQGRTPETGKFYIGKEAMAINATVKAAHNFSEIQDAADGARFAPAYDYERANKDGSVGQKTTVEAITDGSWYVESLLKKQPFALIISNNGQSYFLFQDVWARPGRYTKFEFQHNGRQYSGQTEGNRLYIAEL